MSSTTRDNLRTAIRLMDAGDRINLIMHMFEMREIGDLGAVKMCHAILSRWDEMFSTPSIEPPRPTKRW